MESTYQDDVYLRALSRANEISSHYDRFEMACELALTHPAFVATAASHLSDREKFDVSRIYVIMINITLRLM